MVLYKRKPIAPSNAPPVSTIPNNAEVWEMRATGEVFTSYEQYLQRLDYYNQRNFTCEITGHTNMTFFEALKSETHGQAQVDNTFPEQLRNPILRKVQFSTTPRIDELVNALYEQFKEDFFPGEKVILQLDEGDPLSGTPRLEGIIKDKVSFPEVRRLDGSIERPAVSRYFIAIVGKPQEALADNKHIFRDRRSFTKNVLRSFLKNSISRDRWDGAPWLVKEHLAKAYDIDMVIPTKLLYENVVAERKALAALRKGRPDDQCLQYFAQLGELPQLAEATRVHHGKLPKYLVEQFEDSLTSGRPVRFNNFANEFGPDTMMPPVPQRQRPPPQPPVKYPIDDLEIRPRHRLEQRPAYRVFTAAASQVAPEEQQELDPRTIGTLLELWNTFNVHTSLYKVDSFTFDDFVDAMLFKSADLECELLNEVHCAAMKLLVDEAGVLDPYIPAVHEQSSDSEGDDSTADNSAVSTPAPEETRRTSGRGRTSMLKNDITAALKVDSPKRNGAVHHRVEEMLGDTDWQSRLMLRDFTNGGWQVILAGILMHMSTVLVKERSICERILAHLAPLDQKATRETARRQYYQLDCDLRTSALEILLSLTVPSKAMKDSMERRQEQMTEDRKDKVQRQRDRKTLAEELVALEEERKKLFPEEATPPAEGPSDGIVKTDDSAVKMEIDQEPKEEIDDSDEAEDSDDEVSARRRISSRTNDLKRKREEDDARKEKDKQARLEAKASQSAQKKVLKDIEAKKKAIRKCEEEILEFEEQLRQNACHRTRVLGRDRFWNRYYWFERNGMPFSGQANSSTAAYGYANGRLWIQGPDDMEREGFIDLPENEQAQYRAAFGVTIPQRRDMEEGPAQLKTAYDWGYYATPEELDALLSYLDDRGNRERALKKEIHAWRDRIVESMAAVQQRFDEIEKRRIADAEPVVGIATRKKTKVDDDAIVRHPCLAWRNETARRELGQLHSDGKVEKKGREEKKKAAREKMKEAIAVADEPVTTRRGTRYR